MDRRLVNVYVEELFRDEALTPGKLQLCSLPQYLIPDEVTRTGILQYIGTWPDVDKVWKERIIVLMFLCI
jgi:hypothetical protein